MIKSDMELLELAAKAYDIELDRWNGAYACYETNIGLWNPLLDDGDALRLAVHLDLLLMPYPDDGAVRVTKLYQPDTIVSYGIPPDKNSSTRRAIVRAAAEIGKNMKND